MLMIPDARATAFWAIRGDSVLSEFLGGAFGIDVGGRGQ
jgi:hypothetical protein